MYGGEQRRPFPMLTIALALMYDISLIDASKNQGTTKTQTVIDFLIQYVKYWIGWPELLDSAMLCMVDSVYDTS